MNTVLRVLLSAAAYVGGVVLTGALAPLLRLPAFIPIPGTSASIQFALLVASAPLLVLALLPLTNGLRGGWTKRWIATASLLFVTIGLNTMIELKVFSNLLPGSAWVASLHSLFPCALAAAVLTKRSNRQEARSAMRRSSAAEWAGRLLIAWLAFPLGYWVFGVLAAPFVIGYYQAGHSGFLIPSPSLVLRTQVLRGALLLAATLPAVLLWKKSRTEFTVSMGLAQAVAIGIFPLLQAYFFPAVVRVVHSLEISATSFAYAAVLGVLFIELNRTTESQEKATRNAE